MLLKAHLKLPTAVLLSMSCSDGSCKIFNFYVCCRKNESLSFVSSFAEELGCFPKITHTNRATPLSCLDIMLHLNEAKLHDNHIKSLMPYFQTINTVQTVTKQMVLKPYETEIHFPYMISSLKKAVSNLRFIVFSTTV